MTEHHAFAARLQRISAKAAYQRRRIADMLQAGIAHGEIAYACGVVLSTVKAVERDRLLESMGVETCDSDDAQRPIDARRAELLAAIARPNYVYLTLAECEEIEARVKDGRISQAAWRGVPVKHCSAG